MADTLQVMIDLTDRGQHSDPETLEEETLSLADEMREGKLVESVQLTRQTDLPKKAKSGALAFISGMLTTEISRENLSKAVDFLGNRFYGKTLTIEYKADGLECSLEYRNKKEMDRAINGIERLESLRVRVKEK